MPGKSPLSHAARDSNARNEKHAAAFDDVTIPIIARVLSPLVDAEGSSIAREICAPSVRRSTRVASAPFTIRVTREAGSNRTAVG